MNNIKEAIDFHNLDHESKSFFTKNKNIINIAQDILGENYCDFEINKIEEKPSEITFSDINNSKFLDNYLKNKGKKIMIAAGGPAAEEQIIIAVSDPNIKNKFDEFIYLTRNYLESNANHSTKQIHSRNSSALYANDHFAGHKLLLHSICKKLFPKKYNILDINYPKIDVKLSLNSKLLKIYFKNELNWIYQKIRKIANLRTDYDLDLEKTKKSIEIQHNIEKKHNINLKIDSLPAIEIILKNQKYKNKSNNKLSKSQIKDIFGTENSIMDILIFKEDNVLRYDIHKINAKIAQENGAKWLENTEIKEILLDNDKLAGIVTKNNQYIYSSKLHLSLGYKAKYKFDTKFKINNLNNNIIATGISSVIIVRNSLKTQKIFNISSAILLNDIYISLIDKNQDYIILKIAAGANIGSNKYKNSYFFNILEHLKIIFTSDLAGILSCYGCSRSINSNNSTKFTKIGKDIIISDGKGGSGNSKRYFEGDLIAQNLSNTIIYQNLAPTKTNIFKKLFFAFYPHKGS
jgi:hypothetical protein